VSKFTDRFITLSVNITKTDSITDNEEILCKDFIRLNPFEIMYYRKHFDDDGNYDNSVTLYFKNGDNVIVILPIEQFELLLNNHAQ
jgi:hypothetical protein